MNRRAFSLVEILATIVIIMVLAAILLPRYLSGATGPGGKKGEAPIKRAKGVECQNNLSQIRMGLQTAAFGDEDGARRQLLDALEQRTGGGDVA